MTSTEELIKANHVMIRQWELVTGTLDGYSVHLGPQGYTFLMHPLKGEITSLTEPEDITWHRELKPMVDELNKQQEVISTLSIAVVSLLHLLSKEKPE